MIGHRTGRMRSNVWRWRTLAGQRGLVARKILCRCSRGRRQRRLGPIRGWPCSGLVIGATALGAAASRGSVAEPACNALHGLIELVCTGDREQRTASSEYLARWLAELEAAGEVIRL